ncbi:DMT family transporter, partial [Pseudonocardia sp. KRD291]|uniref:DMT family transporter n=1 Tax=Pseudonocardia sp. KRD291 TaxID=2792007 RepID=UPI001C4A5B0A
MGARFAAGPAAAVGAVLLWSTNAYAAGEVLASTTVLQLLTVQYGAAAVALIVVRAVLLRSRTGPIARPAEVRGESGSGRRTTVVVPLAVGVLGLTATIFLQYLAFDTAPLVGANVICYADGLIAALWVAARRPSRHTLIGMPLALIGFGGVLVVLTDGAGIGEVAIGYLFALASAACMAFYSLASGRATGSTFNMLIPATVTGTVIALGLSLVRGEAWPAFAEWAGAIYIGLGPMAAGYALWTYAMADGRADRLIPLSYATPLVSTGLLLATGQPFTGRTLLGAGLILLCSTGV